MRLFNCDHCGNLVFFENTKCYNCGRSLGFLPSTLRLHSLDKNSNSIKINEFNRNLKYCSNHYSYDACNFLIEEEEAENYCISCRQTKWLPDLSDTNNLRRWKIIEDSKRRLFYTLAKLHLTILDGIKAPEFEFLADLPGQPSVLTGHRSGTITLNVVEADDDERARRRIQLGEPYRTLSGHLRHESGHFFWDILIAQDQTNLKEFRELFGDEETNYQDSLRKYYDFTNIARSQWHENFISEYATAHPWEDWAETWAHYLHFMDLSETSSSYQLQIALPQQNNLYKIEDPFDKSYEDFNRMLSNYIPITLLANSLNRSLGQQDAYPFTLSNGAIRKLRFIHKIVTSQKTNTNY